MRVLIIASARLQCSPPASPPPEVQMEPLKGTPRAGAGPPVCTVPKGARELLQHVSQLPPKEAKAFYDEHYARAAPQDRRRGAQGGAAEHGRVAAHEALGAGGGHELVGHEEAVLLAVAPPAREARQRRVGERARQQLEPRVDVQGALHKGAAEGGTRGAFIDCRGLRPGRKR